MNETPNKAAIVLAEQLEDTESARLHLLPYAAAELRRLHAENEAAHAVGIRQEQEIMNLEALLRQALEALQKIAAIENKEWGAEWEEIEEAREIARAAIAKATGENA